MVVGQKRETRLVGKTLRTDFVKKWTALNFEKVSRRTVGALAVAVLAAISLEIIADGVSAAFWGSKVDAGSSGPESSGAPFATADHSAEPNNAETNPALEGEGSVDSKLSERARKSAAVLDEVMGTPEGSIPSSLLRDARCVAVVPNVVKVGFVIGGRHGKGLVSCRTKGGWSRPSFVTLSGGSFGLQIGAQATDFVLVFGNRRAAERLTESKFTLGGDASVSAGPVGRTAEAGTDVKFQTEILSYSRSRGLFAGVSLEGATLQTDRDANEEVYGAGTSPEDLLFTRGGSIPAGLGIFVRTLQRHAS